MHGIAVPFFTSLLRNRRGAACTACFCLLWGCMIMFGTWSAQCFLQRRLLDFPAGFVPVLTVLGTLKGWQYREDARRQVDNPPA